MSHFQGQWVVHVNAAVGYWDIMFNVTFFMCAFVDRQFAAEKMMYIKW